MASRVGTVLSDAHILKHCAIYQPIPMHMANTILNKDLKMSSESSPYISKKLKYHNSVSRPASFNTLANSLTRVSGGDLRIRDHLINSYTSEIDAPPVNPATRPVTPMPPSTPQAASITPRRSRQTTLVPYSLGSQDLEDTNLVNQFNELFDEIDADIQSNPRTPRLDYDTPSEVESDGYFTGDNDALEELAQLHHMGPLPPFAFRQPLDTGAGIGAGSSTDHRSLDLLDAMARMNEDNAANPKTPGSKSTYFDA